MNSKNKHNKLYFAVVATDAVCFRVTQGRLMTLIARTPSHSPFPGQWALVGGMVRSHETAEDTISRLLCEKAGIENIYIEQVHTFSAVDRDPRGRVVSIAYLALTYADPQDVSKASLQTSWVPAEELPNLAYDHDSIFKEALEKLRFEIQNTDVAKHLISPEFTLSELQKTHEAVMGQGIDKRNFRKKILLSNTLKDTKKTRKEGVMRPAVLYRFKSL